MAAEDANHGHTTGTEAPGSAAHGEGAFPPFDSTHFTSQLIWLAIIFGALYYLMSKIALPRIEGILTHRQGTISGDMEEAQRLQARADDASKAYDKTLADAKANAQALAQQTHHALALETEAKRKQLEGELDAKLADAEAQIARTKAAAMTNVEGIAREAAAAIVQQITGRPAQDAAIAAALAQSRTA